MISRKLPVRFRWISYHRFSWAVPFRRTLCPYLHWEAGNLASKIEILAIFDHFWTLFFDFITNILKNCPYDWAENFAQHWSYADPDSLQVLTRMRYYVFTESLSCFLLNFVSPEKSLWLVAGFRPSSLVFWRNIVTFSFWLQVFRGVSDWSVWPPFWWIMSTRASKKSNCSKQKMPSNLAKKNRSKWYQLNWPSDNHSLHIVKY